MTAQQKPEKVKLPPEVAERLKDLTANLESTRGQLASLRKIGIDTKKLEDQLDWAEMARKTLLEDFT